MSKQIFYTFFGCITYWSDSPLDPTYGTLCFLYNSQSDDFSGKQSFVAGPVDVRGREEETVTSTVLQLEREGVFDAQVVGPVIGTTWSQVWRENDTHVDFLGNWVKVKIIFTLLTYCLCPSTVLVGVWIIFSDFLCSVFSHLQLIKQSMYL